MTRRSVSIHLRLIRLNGDLFVLPEAVLTDLPFLIAVCFLAAATLSSLACTRAVYIGSDGDVITGRSMDWKVDVGINSADLSPGMHRDGAVGPHSFEWTSKYGSVIATGYDVSTRDGINGKGLVANALWLVELEYPKPSSSKLGLAVAVWVQYVLDNFITVQEAVTP